jgi:hypothetical protein
MTNGNITFPKQRPTGSQWRNLPVPSMPERYWNPFLAALEGRFLSELIPWEQLTKKVKEEAEPKQEETERQEKLTVVVRQGHGLWQGCADCKHLAVGAAIVFEVPRLELGTAWVVDVPRVGAIYFFGTKEVAVNFARGGLRRSAIRPHQQHVDHLPGWESRVEEVLKTISAQSFSNAG